MTNEPIVECVPNFSEGNNIFKVVEIIRAMREDGVRLLDFSLDRDHNRAVVTIAGRPAAVVEAAVRAVGRASELLDLTGQTGVHPRIGVADVIPFVPVSSISLAECAMLARQAGLQIWRRYGVPVYFYGAAAARPDRIELENIRRGQFEGLRKSALNDASRRPDIGGPELHPTAGASAVGARSFLIAYNVYLDSASSAVPASAADIGAARAVARDIRAASGGLHGVKAIGVVANGRAQVSMNITDFRVTSLGRVYEAVCDLAARHGAAAGEGELVGLIPEEAVDEGAVWAKKTLNFDPDLKIFERRLEQRLPWPDSVQALR